MKIRFKLRFCLYKIKESDRFLFFDNIEKCSQIRFKCFIHDLKNMVFTKKQEEELRTLTYEALRKLTGRYSDVYTSGSSVASLVAYLVTDKLYVNYQHDRIIKILNQFCREGKAKKIRIVAYSPPMRHEDSSVRAGRRSYVYRVSP